MEWIEVTGRTIEEAKELALDRLGVSDVDLEFEVIEAPRAGFLGMGRTDARIRARVKPLSREKPDDRRRRRRGRGEARNGRSEPERAGEADHGAPPADPTPAGAVAASRTRTRSRRRGRRGGHRGPTSPAEVSDSTPPAAAPPEGATMVDEIPPAAQREVAEEFVRELVRAFGVDADVVARITEDERVEVTIEGDRLGILIGPDAATLDAIEELTQAVVQTRCDGHAGRIRVDVAGYRERRRAALEEFTRRVADEVRTSGEPRRLEPMGSTDRKVVHDVIAAMGDLETTSEGMEPRRYVVVRPAR